MKRVHGRRRRKLPVRRNGLAPTSFLGLQFQWPAYWVKDLRQVDNARLIFARFIAAGLGPGIAAAAVVNSLYESALDDQVISGGGRGPGGDPTKAAGLFQLHPATGAAGEGMSLPDRLDRRKNINRILDVIKGRKAIRIGGAYRTDTGNRLRSMKNSASIAELTEVFCADIERPGSGCSPRKDLARELLGPMADIPANQLPWIPWPVGTVVSTPWYVTAGVGVGAVLLGTYGFFAYRRKSFMPWRG